MATNGVGWVAFAALLGVVSSCSNEPVVLTGGLTTDVGSDDVSFLYPLPTLQQRTSLLGAASKGPLGMLLPKEIFQGLPPLDILTPNSETYHLLRVVSVRVDPCFPGLGVLDEAQCQNQIRLVMQPLLPDTQTEGLVASDEAVHLFYSLTRPEIVLFLQSFIALREEAGVARSDGPPGVHPALAREGVEGPFATALRARLLGQLGAGNLKRVTFMALGSLGQQWRFGGFDVEGATLRPMSIPLVAARDQTFTNLDLNGATFDRAGIAPASSIEADFYLLLDPLRFEAASKQQRLTAYNSALRIENPRLYSPDTLDCATCHAAPGARTYAERTFGLSPSDAHDRYEPPAGSVGVPAKARSTNELRAFGYFGLRPSVSQRTIHETTEVVEYVNRHMREASAPRRAP